MNTYVLINARSQKKIKRNVQISYMNENNKSKYKGYNISSIKKKV